MAIIYFGRKIPDYRPIKSTISELGEVGSPVEKVVGSGVFFPIGLLLLFLSLLLYFQGLQNDIQTALCGLSASVGVGYIVAAFFPCDPGSPIDKGSSRQQIHNLGGVVEYIGGAYFLIASSIPYLSTLGYLILSGAIAMSFSISYGWRGLIQRLAELGLFGSMVWLSMM